MPTIVQSRSIRGTNTTSASGSFRATPTAGNMVAVLVGGWDSGGFSISSLVDNQGNTYTKYAENASSATNVRSSIWIAHNVAASGTFTITITSASAGTWLDASMIEIEGADTSSAVDVTASNRVLNTSTDANVTAGSAIAQANELWLSCAILNQTNSPANNDCQWGAAPTSPDGTWYNIRQSPNYSGNTAFSADYFVSDTIATPSVQYSHAATTGASNGWTVSLVTIKGTFEEATWLPWPSTGELGSMCNALSFDDADTSTMVQSFASANTGNTIVSTGGARNSGRLRMTSNTTPRTTAYFRPSGSTGDVFNPVLVAFWLRVDALTGISTDTWNNSVSLAYFSGTFYNAHLGIDSNRRLYWQCVSTAPAIRGATQLTIGQEYYVEVRLNSAGGIDGDVELYINGVVDAQHIGCATIASSALYPNRVDLLYGANPGGTIDISIDDFSVWENGNVAGESWLEGPFCPATSNADRWPHIYTFFPTGDVTTTNWTPSTGGDHYALADEVIPSNSDGSTSTTSSAPLRYSVSPTGLINGTIAGVLHRVYANFSGANGRLRVGITDTVNAVDMNFTTGVLTAADTIARTSHSYKSPLTRQWTYAEALAAQPYVEINTAAGTTSVYRSTYQILAYGDAPITTRVPIWALSNSLRSRQHV